MFFLSFRLSSQITPPISLCLPFPILYLSLSLYRCFSVPLAFSLTLHALLLVSFSFLFHLYYFLPFFSPLELFSRPSSPSFPHSLSRFISCCFFCVCVWFLFQEGGCRHCPVLALHNKALMSLHTDVNRNIRPWSHQSAVAMVTKCHRSHPRKKKGERDGEMARRRGEKCAVCVCAYDWDQKIFVQGDVWWEYMIYNISVLNVAWTVDRDRKEAKSSQWYWYIDLCAHLCVFII